MRWQQAEVTGPDPAKDPTADEIDTTLPLAGMKEEEFSKLCQSIMLCVPYRLNEGVSANLWNNAFLWGNLGVRAAGIKDPHGGFIEVTRNGITRLFLNYCQSNPEVKYCIMIDNDMNIRWDGPLQLARRNLPIVSGVACNYSDERGIFCCFTTKDENGVPRFPSWRDTKVLPATGLIKAVQVGTGYLCIRRDVLETIWENEPKLGPFGLDEETRIESLKTGNLRKSEDITFAERATKYGFQSYVDFSTHATHNKTISIGWPLDSIADIEAPEWKPSPFDYRGVVG